MCTKSILMLHLACVVATGALAEEVSCPKAEQITLSASAQGWNSYPVANAFDSPRIVLDNMRVTPNHLWCQYRVGEGTVRLRIIRECKPGRGEWTEQGALFQVCKGPDAAQCVAQCP